MKILNLYAGIGGNRKLWGDEHEITAIENNPKIAAIYQDLYPNDTVIVADAHKYLLEHYKEFDFIWSSPPCPTHSRMRTLKVAQGCNVVYPDMALYQEILLLKYWFKGKWAVENVITYYEPLITPQISNNHYFWTNYPINKKKNEKRGIRGQDFEHLKKRLDMGYIEGKTFEKKVLRNCVEPELGKEIFEFAFNKKQEVLF